jgi:hypothetical protein
MSLDVMWKMFLINKLWHLLVQIAQLDARFQNQLRIPEDCKTLTKWVGCIKNYNCYESALRGIYSYVYKTETGLQR